MVINRVLGREPHTPTQFFWEYPPPPTGLYRAMQNTAANTISATYAAHDGKLGCKTVEYTTAFQHSDVLYFTWHGTNITTYITYYISKLVLKFFVGAN